MATVYVISQSGTPLMPTTRCGHVRRLLKMKKARVVERKPFTIQLLYETPEKVQELILGIDPGRTNIGVSVVKENGDAVFMAQLATRNKEIPKLMVARQAFRNKHRTMKRRNKRRRRAVAAGTQVNGGSIRRILPGYEKPVVCHDIRNKEARFNNRKRPDGWLTPTATQLLRTHINLIRKLQKFLPISKVVVELNKFDFMALDNPHICKWEYQYGPLHGYGSVEAAVFEQQDGHCIFCSNKIDHYHRIVPKHLNGSETLKNRVGLCEKHHALVHTDEQWAKKLVSKKEGCNKKYHALSVLNQIIPYLMEELPKLLPTYATNGHSTKAYRETNGITKDHHLDAYCIACSVLPEKYENAKYDTQVFQYQQFRRHDRQACHKENIKRVYQQDGKTVATNRHKAFEQKEDSLQEYRLSHTEAEVSALTVKEHHPIYKDTKRTLPGALYRCADKMYTLMASSGRHKGVPDYWFSADGTRSPYKQCKIMQHNRGICCV